MHNYSSDLGHEEPNSVCEGQQEVDLIDADVQCRLEVSCRQDGSSV